MSITSIKDFSRALQACTDRLEKKLSSLHVGRATPALLDGVIIEAYDDKIPLSSVASISVQPPHTLIIQPWDHSVIKAIEKSLMAANLGAMPAVDGNMIRLTFQPPTEEKRKLLIKEAEQAVEEAKVAAKSPREEYMRYLKQQKLNGLSENAHDKELEIMQKTLHNAQEIWREMKEKKEKELLTL